MTELFFDYISSLNAFIWLWLNAPVVILSTIVVYFIFFKRLNEYIWWKLLLLLVVKYISFHIAFVDDTEDAQHALNEAITIVFVTLYLFAHVIINFIYFNMLFFQRDEFWDDIKYLFKWIVKVYSKIRGKRKVTQQNTLKTKNAAASNQIVTQVSSKKISTPSKKQQQVSKNLILPPQKKITITNKGQKVYTDNGHTYILQKKIGFGGEGDVFIITTQLLAKIFHPNKATSHKLFKLQKFLSMKKISSVVFPLKILYNQNKNFIGYIMPQVFGVKELGVLHILKNRALYCPHWTYYDLIDLSISIAKTLEKLHKANIIVADFNPRNVLVKSPKHIYFIDIDSYQVDRQPSTVGVLMYLRPIHIDKKHKKYLKNKSDDLYALSMMIFQNLTSGGNPYTTKQGGNDEELVRKHVFAFNVEEPEKSNARDGLINAWSQLSLELRKFFEDVFRYQKPVFISTLIQALEAHKRTLSRVQTNTRRK